MEDKLAETDAKLGDGDKDILSLPETPAELEGEFEEEKEGETLSLPDTPRELEGALEEEKESETLSLADTPRELEGELLPDFEDVIDKAILLLPDTP
jgi:hypothetical protein